MTEADKQLLRNTYPIMKLCKTVEEFDRENPYYSTDDFFRQAFSASHSARNLLEPIALRASYRQGLLTYYCRNGFHLSIKLLTISQELTEITQKLVCLEQLIREQ